MSLELVVLQIYAPAINLPLSLLNVIAKREIKKKSYDGETVWVYQVQKFKKGISGVLSHENQIQQLY